MRSMTLLQVATRAVLTASLVVGVASRAEAQKSKCGPTAEMGASLDYVVNLLTDPDSASVAQRAELGITVPDTTTKSVVTDSRVCNQLLGATRAKLRSIYGGKDNPFSDMTFAFFRVGDYYVAMQINDPHPTLIVNERSEFLVFKVTDLAFVARLLA